MIIKSILSAAVFVGMISTTVSALDLPRITFDNGDVYAAVPLPPRRGHGGSVYAIVSQAAERYGVPQKLAHAVIHIESKHNCSARNRSGASGLGQLMPGTARNLGVRNPMSCQENANGAMRYLAAFYQQSGGNWCVAASAYQRGSLGGCSSYGRKVMRIASQ